MTDIRDVLAEKLAAMDLSDLRSFATLHGVELRVARRAATCQPITADAFLRLAAGGGIEPMTGGSIPPRAVGALDRNTLGAGLRITMGLRRHSTRQMRTHADLSAPAAARIRQGHSVSILSVVKACRYIGTDALGYCAPTWLHVKQADGTPTRTPLPDVVPQLAEGGDA